MQVRGQKIVVLGTGGTIAGTAAAADDNIGYTAAQVGVEQLLHAVPGLQAASGGSLVAEQIAQLDSKDMEFSVWGALAQRCASTLADPDVRALLSPTAPTRWKRPRGSCSRCWMPISRWY